MTQRCRWWDDDCNELGLGDDVLEALQCISIGITSGHTIWDECACDDSRDVDECTDEPNSYSCSDNFISSDGDLWEIVGNIATTTDIQTIEAFMLEFGLSGDPEDFGINCLVTTSAELTRE